jgi:hypothetical protein
MRNSFLVGRRWNMSLASGITGLYLQKLLILISLDPVVVIVVILVVVIVVILVVVMVVILVVVMVVAMVVVISVVIVVAILVVIVVAILVVIVVAILVVMLVVMLVAMCSMDASHADIHNMAREIVMVLGQPWKPRPGIVVERLEPDEQLDEQISDRS